MASNTLEERVAAIEQQLKAMHGNSSAVGKDWRRTRGTFTGDELMKQVFEEGRKIREADRKRARRASSKKRMRRS